MSTREPRPTASNAAAQGFEDATVWQAAELGGLPAQLWAAELAARAAESDAAATRALAGLEELTSSRVLLDQIQSRWGGTDQAQFAGRIFEYQQRTSFNVSAAELGKSLRALVTEFEGAHPDPHDAADIRVVDAGGHTLSEYQAKVVANEAARVHQLAAARYEGLGLVAPTDHVTSARDLIERRTSGANPNFLAHDAYQSVNDRLGDTVTYGGASSAPISSEQTQAAAKNPDAYFRQRVEEQQAKVDHHVAASQEAQSAIPVAEFFQVAGAAGAGALTGFAVSALFKGVSTTARVRAGEMSATDAALTTVSEASSAAERGAFVGGAGKILELGASHGVVPAGLGSGALPYAVARATWEVGAIGVQLARGDIDSREAASRTAMSTLRIAFTYGGSVVGQTLIPVPIVGAVIGGTVGSICAAATFQGLALARSMKDELELTRAQLAILDAEIRAAVIVLDAERQWIELSTASWENGYRSVIVPAIERINEAVKLAEFINVVPAAAEIMAKYGGAPLFTTLEEFDVWMLDSQTELVLRTNPSRVNMH